MSTQSSRLRSVGQTYHQFKVTKAIEIPELQCFLRELIHEPSGAVVMHIENEDPENLFCLSFQTLPYNSNGVAHILEHTVLCGSRKFPVKDPFFAMNRRSLNTFMNALTGADFTCYPAASQVHQDFYNLLEVYLDAVFHPILNELSFLQEGHRLEFSQPFDPNTPLEFKGIVYNEMKGALSSANARLSEAIHETLFPNVTYGCNSGGDPKHIPELTYEELKQFYQIYYHPSRCLFFFYGNMPLEKHLDFIAEHTLNHTHKVPPLPSIPLQPRFKAPVYRELTYPIAPEEDTTDKTLIAFGWLTCHILEQQDVLALNILEIILMDTDASPLKMALLQSGLCKQASSFIDIELNEIPWGITLKGCQPEHADALEKVVKETLERICQTGIPLQMIENAIHQLEFYRSEITGDHAPFGLSLFMRSGLLKQHGVDPEKGLTIHSLFDRVRQAVLADPHYFSHLIKKYLLDNPHYTRIIMRPDPQLEAKEAEAEKKLLADIKAQLSPDQIQEIIRKAAQLAEFQKKQEEEDIDILPKVSLNDIPIGTKDYSLIQEKVGHLTTFHHNVFTNDIVYADLVFNLPNLEEKDLAYLRLFTVVLTQVGCDARSYQENLEYIQGNTGGIGAGISLNLHADNYHHFSPTFHLRGKALHRKAAKLFSLLHETVATAKIDDLKRLKEIIFKHFTGMESRLNQSALKYAINLSASSLNVASKVANDLYGLNYYWQIREIVKDFDKQGPYVLAKLQEIQEQVTCLDDPHLVLSCNGAMYDEFKSHGFYGLKDIETSPYEPWKGHFPLQPLSSQGRIIASPVAFIGKVFPTVSYTHPDAPALNIAAFLFDNLTLHTKIREQGGAYGGGAVSNPMSGNFYFYSYRDPNVTATFNAFEEAVQTVLKGDFDESDLEEAKFEMIQGLDAPVSPGSQAEVAYGWWREGRTLEVRQAFRNKLLSLTREEVIEAVECIIAQQMDKGAAVIFSSTELLEKANQELLAQGKSPLLIKTV
jgi:hypothetical protein